MQINRINVKYGRQVYSGYYWVEEKENGLKDLFVFYEGIRQNRPLLNVAEHEHQARAEHFFRELLQAL
jgi:hypothetical protein